MSIIFSPAGFPVSSSFANSTLFSVTASVLQTPVTASVAEYVINFYGPTGPAGVTVNASL